MKNKTVPQEGLRLTAVKHKKGEIEIQKSITENFIFQKWSIINQDIDNRAGL